MACHMPADCRAGTRHRRGAAGHDCAGRGVGAGEACRLDRRGPPLFHRRGGGACAAVRADVGACDATPHPAAGEAFAYRTRQHHHLTSCTEAARGVAASWKRFDQPPCISFCLHAHVQPTLERLPALALAEDAAFENDFLEPVAALTDIAGSAPAASSTNGSGARQDAPRTAKPPCPVDLAVPPQAAVVMITGGRPCCRTCALTGRQCHQCVLLDLCSSAAKLCGSPCL